jgi:enoyl-CoA hydratase/carnithine racemase
VTLRLEPHGAAVHLVIDRTDKANAFTQAMWEAVPALVAEAEATPGARVLVLRSATPKVFSAGADVAEYRANAGDPAWGHANHERVSGATAALHGSRLATVAAVSGPCAGGGVGLVVACDLRVASDDATFSVPPAKLALVYPQADTARLVDLVGPSAAKLLLLSARRVDAPWALRSGLVDEVVAADSLDGAVADLVADLAAGAPVSVRGMKQAIDLAMSGVREEDAATRALLDEALRSPDHLEGVTAFLERRPPRFG